MVNPWLSDDSVAAAGAAALDSKVEDKGGKNQNVNMYTGDMQSDTQTKGGDKMITVDVLAGFSARLDRLCPFACWIGLHMTMCIYFCV